MMMKDRMEYRIKTLRLEHNSLVVSEIAAHFLSHDSTQEQGEPSKDVKKKKNTHTVLKHA